LIIPQQQPMAQSTTYFLTAGDFLAAETIYAVT